MNLDAECEKMLSDRDLLLCALLFAHMYVHAHTQYVFLTSQFPIRNI